MEKCFIMKHEIRKCLLINSGYMPKAQESVDTKVRHGVPLRGQNLMVSTCFQNIPLAAFQMWSEFTQGQSPGSNLRFAATANSDRRLMLPFSGMLFVYIHNAYETCGSKI
jgi:hypothetical protein